MKKQGQGKYLGLEVMRGLFHCAPTKRKRLTAPHDRTRISFAHPPKKGDYMSVWNQIQDEGYSNPTMPETASLVYSAFRNPDEPHSQEIIELIEKGLLWGFTEDIWTPKGVYIQKKPSALEKRTVLTEAELKEKLDNRGETMEFVPCEDIELGEQTPKQLSRNALVIALAGFEGADKLAEVAAKNFLGPRAYVWGYEEVSRPIVRVSALTLGAHGYGLNVGTDYLGGIFGAGMNGFAFGRDKGKTL